MIRSASGASSVSTTHPANDSPPKSHTPIAKALKSARQGQANLESPEQSARLKPQGGVRKMTVAAMREQKQQRIAELNRNYKKFEAVQLIQTQKKVDSTYADMQNKNKDPSCSEEVRAKCRQRYFAALATQNTSLLTLLPETMELITLEGDSGAIRRQCNLLVTLVNNARAQIGIRSKDANAVISKCPPSRTNAEQISIALQTEGTVVLDDVLKFMGESSKIYETMIKLHTDVGSWLDQLKKMAHQGANDLKKLTSDRPDNAVAVLDSTFRQLATLPLLSAKEPFSDTSEALGSAINSLLLVSESHIELQASKHFESGDRIAVLDSLVKHYGKALLQFTSIGIFRADELHKVPFNRLCEIVEQLHDDAERRLTDELQNLADSEKSSAKSTVDQPPTNRASSSPSRKRIIHTDKGALIGDVRPRVANQGGDIVDIKSPVDDRSLASFHEHERNAWVEIVETRTPAPKARVTPYLQLKGDARKALAKIAELMQKFEGHAKRTSEPKGVEECLQNTAQDLINYADRLENHANAPSNSQTDADLVKALHVEAQTISDKATQLRIQISLAQAPTSEAVEYLLSSKEIQPQKSGERKQLKTGRQDFLQEYVLLNRNNQPVWYAHFHYKALNDAKADYTAASLKTKEQRFETNATALAKAQNPNMKVDIYRGHIDKELATKFFLLP
jgi:hypothetical protein